MDVNLLVDARGLKCPEPMMMLHSAIYKISSGEIVSLLADDPVTHSDVKKLTEFLGHKIVKIESKDDYQSFLIEKK